MATALYLTTGVVYTRGFADGTAARPSFASASQPTTGFFFPAAGFVALSVSGTSTHLWGGTEYRVGSGVSIGFASSADTSSAADARLRRNGAGTLIIDQGANTAGALNGGTTLGLGVSNSVTTWQLNTDGSFNGADPTYQFRLGSTTAGGAITSSRLIKNTTAIADAAATATITVTIPNAAHSASLYLQVTGSLGAGGAIGANEATGTIGYLMSIARTAGVNAVVTTSAAFGSAVSSVAGAATITVAAAASAVAGAVGATNTFTVNVTITRGSGSSTNHTCRVVAELINANATGVTMA